VIEAPIGKADGERCGVDPTTYSLRTAMLDSQLDSVQELRLTHSEPKC
jgi:hypothetical protein